MNAITVYHGSTEKVENPICRFGRKHLDFGQGFYVTNLREQAVAWANNTARNRKIPIEIALEELSKHQPNNQMCILNQDIINKHLRYDRTEKL